MATTTLLTSEQFLAMPDEFDPSGTPTKDELIGGEIVRMPRPSLRHDMIKMNIIAALISYVDAHPQFAVKVLAEAAFIVTERDTFVPDASVIAKARLNLKDKYIAGPPNLAIEVVSPSETAIHLKTKVDTYLANGSRSVWTVFPDAKSVVVYSGNSMGEYKADQNIEDPFVPGFSVPVASFFELG
jgi:Uma2 family endonuclease